VGGDEGQGTRAPAAPCFPAVKGPSGRFHIVDHRPLGLAHRWAHPFDHKGRRRGDEPIPESIDGLRDDPYRSLAGCVRNAGGDAKDTQPYAEFVWADCFRARIEAAEIQRVAQGPSRRRRRRPSGDDGIG
jgi:hypothetical protein